jgi:hypothetical protein
MIVCGRDLRFDILRTVSFCVLAYLQESWHDFDEHTEIPCMASLFVAQVSWDSVVEMCRTDQSEMMCGLIVWSD